MRELEFTLSVDADWRDLSAALGLANVVFGAIAFLFPRPFLRFFGLPAGTSVTEGLIARSIAVRDVASGMAIWSAAVHGGKLRPWLLLRLISDGGDSVGVAAALVKGGPNSRLALLGLIALGAALVDFVLWRAVEAPTGGAIQAETAKGAPNN